MTQTPSITLRIRDEQDNLFVRLSQRTVQQLLADDYDHSVSFLPLSISFDGNVTVYASWNGGICEYDDSIEIPSDLALGVSPLPAMVKVSRIPLILPCLKVHVEPFSAKDWELLQCDSDFLQEGGFLRQLSVVYSKQHLRLRLENNDWVELLVNKIESPSSDGEIITCGLLRQDTEVIIQPRKRDSNDAIDWSSPQRLTPSQDDWNDAMLNLHQTMNVEPLYLPPGCILVNETIWNSNYSWALLEPALDTTKQEDKKRIVRVIWNQSITPGNAVLHTWIRQDLGLELFWDSIKIRPTSAPRESIMEDISLVPIQFQSSKSLPAFRKPTKAKSRRNSVVHDESTGAISLPLNSIFELSWLTENVSPQAQLPFSYFRLVDTAHAVNPTQLVDTVLPLDQETRYQLAEICKRKLAEDTHPEILSPANHDSMLCLLAETALSSISWAEPLISSFRKHDQLWTTIWGESGSGKTNAAVLLSAMCTISQQTPSLYLDCKRLQETATSLVEIMTEIDSVFELAYKTVDCIVVFDDIDLIAPNLLGDGEQDSSARVQTANPIAISQSKVVADRVLQMIEATRSSRVSILATSTSMDSLHSSFHNCLGIPKFDMEVPSLSSIDRIKVLEQMVKNGSSLDTVAISKSIGHKMEGFRPRDLEKIAARVRHRLRIEGERLSVDEAISIVLDDYTPLSHLALKDLDRTVSITWEMIGGLSEIKKKLESVVLHPIKYKLIYDQANIKLPRGVLLFGPPGCGKSALVPALAQFCKFPLISCKGPEIFDKYIGASEAKIRELFKRACDVAPSILFLDELDALAPRRGSDHTGVTDRVVNQLLTFLDGVEDSSSGTVYVVAATSRPDKVDPALLRPGRLEQHLFVGPPTSEDDLFDLFSKLISNWNLTEDCQEKFSSIENAKDVLGLVIRDNGSIFPADIKAAFVTAHVNAVHRALEKQKPEDIREVKIGLDDLKSALRDARPSLSGNDALEFKEIFKKFKGGKKKGGETNGNYPELKTTLR